MPTLRASPTMARRSRRHRRHAAQRLQPPAGAAPRRASSRRTARPVHLLPPRPRRARRRGAAPGRRWPTAPAPTPTTAGSADDRAACRAGCSPSSSAPRCWSPSSSAPASWPPQLSPTTSACSCWRTRSPPRSRLGVLILIFGPVSGAHFNPVVSAADWWLGRRTGTGLHRPRPRPATSSRRSSVRSPARSWPT